MDEDGMWKGRNDGNQLREKKRIPSECELNYNMHEYYLKWSSSIFYYRFVVKSIPSIYHNSVHRYIFKIHQTC